jgi:glyoxylase I family protein
MPCYTDILHASLVVADTAVALDFYRDVLGMTVLERPALGFPGAWLRVGGQQLHLLQVDNPDPVTGRPAHGGRDRHVAIAVDDIEDLKARLDRAAVAFTTSRSGRPALFCRDPDGNALEFIQVPQR